MFSFPKGNVNLVKLRGDYKSLMKNKFWELLWDSIEEDRVKALGKMGDSVNLSNDEIRVAIGTNRAYKLIQNKPNWLIEKIDQQLGKE